MIAKSLPVIFAIALLFSSGVFAQSNSLEAKNEFAVWGGFSPDSTRSPFSRVEDARYGTVGVRYARIFKPSRHIALKYTADFIPVAALSFPVNESVGGTVQRVRRSAYAWGVEPLGMQLNFRRKKKVQPFFSINGGLLFFNKNIPNDLGKKFNFSAHIGGGLQFMMLKNKAVTVGYRYHHISNGDRGTINPGFDNNVVYVGFSVFK